jgi:hypothetical protein
MNVSEKLNEIEKRYPNFSKGIREILKTSSDISKILKQITDQIKGFIEEQLYKLIEEQSGKEVIQILISLIKSLEKELLSKAANEEDKKNIKKQLYVSSQYLFMNSSNDVLYEEVKNFVKENMVKISFQDFEFSPQKLSEEIFDAEQPFDNNTVEYLISSFLRFKEYDTKKSNKSSDKKSPYVKMRRHITRLINIYLAGNPILLFTFFHLFLNYIKQEAKKQGSSQENVSDIYDFFLYLLVEMFIERLYMMTESQFLSLDDLKMQKTKGSQRPKIREWYNISLILRALAKHHEKILLFIFGKLFYNAFFLCPFPFGFFIDQIKGEKHVLEFIIELFLFKGSEVIFYDDIAIDNQKWLAIIYMANDQKRENSFKFFCYFYWSFLLAKQEHLNFFDVKLTGKKVEDLLEQLRKKYSEVPPEKLPTIPDDVEVLESITDFFQKGSFSDLFFLWLSKFVMFQNYHKEKSYTVFMSTLTVYHINKPEEKSEKDKIQREIMEKYLEYAKFIMQENLQDKIIGHNRYIPFTFLTEILEQKESAVPDFFEAKQVLEDDLEKLLKVLIREELSREEKARKSTATTTHPPHYKKREYTKSTAKFSKPRASQPKGSSRFSRSQKF